MPPRALFRRLVDDAAMFPPGNASAAVALDEHLRYRGSWFADLVGPLLVPARSLDSFVQAQQAAGSPEVSIVLIGTTDLPRHLAPGVTVAGFEVAAADIPLPEVATGTLAVEISVGPGGDRVLAAVGHAAEPGPVAKFRTGGTTADAFPSEAVLAGVIRKAAAVDVPLKLTAGLHHAVRHTDHVTGFEHHGFLNVLVAVNRARSGADLGAVSHALTIRDSSSLLPEIREVAEPSQLRGRFRSFGCCGVEDPIGDLVELGLVHPEPEERR